MRFSFGDDVSAFLSGGLVFCPIQFGFSCLKCEFQLKKSCQWQIKYISCACALKYTESNIKIGESSAPKKYNWRSKKKFVLCCIAERIKTFEQGIVVNQIYHSMHGAYAFMCIVQWPSTLWIEKHNILWTDTLWMIYGHYLIVVVCGTYCDNPYEYGCYMSLVLPNQIRKCARQIDHWPHYVSDTI